MSQWVAEALCARIEPDLFFPSEGDAVTVSAAKQVCLRCPVKAACLTHAVTVENLAGVWGGLSEKERRPLRRAWIRDHCRNGRKREQPNSPCATCRAGQSEAYERRRRAAA